jgi:glycine hydroxymethyltransferase
MPRIATFHPPELPKGDSRDTFLALPRIELMTLLDYKATFDQLNHLVQRHESWRANCLNLCAAENAMSPAVRGLLNSDLAQRYGDYTGRDLRARRYFGTREVVELEETVAALAAQVFHARHVELRPLSGHTAGNAVIMSLCQPGDLVLELGRHSGGHRLATKLATSPLISLQVRFLPFDPVAFNVDVERTLELVKQHHPKLIILGASNFLFPSPLQELADGLREFPDTTLVYDASHVLGLIAGGRFQAPLVEGAQVVLAGTQKSFPGPQGGLIYSDTEDLMEMISSSLYPSLISNHHLARLPSLGLALLEMRRWGPAYADQVIRNAKALGEALITRNVPVVAADRGYTESHMILLPTVGLGDVEELGHRLEEANAIVTAVRLPQELGGAGLRVGVAEVTRRGADETLMDEIAQVLANVLLRHQPITHVKAQVESLSKHLQALRFTLEDLTTGDV